jgi:tetratricopeptide (TPR) repeat protein
MIKNPIRILICALSLGLPCGVSFGATVDELVKQGDVYDLKFNPKEALKFYLPAEELEPKNVQVLLRIARQYRHEMADACDLKEKVRLSEIGLNYARRAVALAPKDSEAHLSIAICYAKSLELYDNQKKMAALRQVKTSADEAIALDSDNDLAWYILGRWHERVADLGGLKRKVAELAYGSLPTATNDEAAKCFCKAISINPNRCVYYVDLGITYAAMEKKAEAKPAEKKVEAKPVEKKSEDVKPMFVDKDPIHFAQTEKKEVAAPTSTQKVVEVIN